jgi:hypothetical protein
MRSRINAERSATREMETLTVGARSSRPWAGKPRPYNRVNESASALVVNGEAWLAHHGDHRHCAISP